MEQLDAQDLEITPKTTNSVVANIDEKRLSSEDSPYELTLRRNDFPEEKNMNQFIKKVEAIVRKSPEYKDWTSYIKDVLGHYSCELTGEMAAQVTVEIHHHPISLFIITKAMIVQYINSDKGFCSFDIAQDVINLHYENRIGYIPLVKTLHEKFHNGFLLLPMELVKGDWKHITQQYEHDDADLEIIQTRLAINFSNCGWIAGQYYWSNNEELKSAQESIG